MRIQITIAERERITVSVSCVRHPPYVHNDWFVPLDQLLCPLQNLVLVPLCVYFDKSDFSVIFHEMVYRHHQHRLGLPLRVVLAQRLLRLWSGLDVAGDLICGCGV